MSTALQIDEYRACSALTVETSGRQARLSLQVRYTLQQKELPDGPPAAIPVYTPVNCIVLRPFRRCFRTEGKRIRGFLRYLGSAQEPGIRPFRQGPDGDRAERRRQGRHG